MSQLFPSVCPVPHMMGLGVQVLSRGRQALTMDWGSRCCPWEAGVVDGLAAREASGFCHAEDWVGLGRKASGSGWRVLCAPVTLVAADRNQGSG